MTALDSAVAALLALRPAAVVNRWDGVTFRPPPADDPDTVSEIYADGDDIDTSYDLLEECQ